jgi:hypothetical protein
MIVPGSGYMNMGFGFEKSEREKEEGIQIRAVGCENMA